MRKRFFSWLGKTFIELSGEAKPAASATSEARELFRRFDQELKRHGLSLDNTVRTRLWGRDRASRDLGSDERVKVLSGKARSASSSYIAPDYFDSDATVAVDLLAMKPSRQEVQKHIVEYDPAIVTPTSAATASSRTRAASAGSSRCRVISRSRCWCRVRTASARS